MEKIDAVITWVDGEDPEHQRKRLQASQRSPLEISRNSNVPTRFQNNGEIYFCIASILKYAPFIRKIFIVTDAQIPAKLESFAKSGICERDKIVIIDHSEIFKGFEKHLPTFNSLSIETMLWRIPGLSQEFIYFNDDMFLASDNTKQDFVFPDGRLVIYGTMMRVWPRVFKARLKRWEHKLRPKKPTNSVISLDKRWRLIA